MEKSMKITTIASGVAALTCVAGTTHAAIIADANFTGLTANNVTTVAISGTPGVNDFAWTRLAGNTHNFSTPNVNMQTGTANALRNNSTATFQGMIGTMASATTIAIGETLTLSFIGQYTETPGDGSGRLRFGFINAYNNTTNANADNAFGVSVGTGTDNSLNLIRDTTPNNGPLGGTIVTLGSSTGTQNIGTSVYTASFAVTRTAATTYSYVANVNGSTVSATGQTVGFTNYNAITILNGNTSADFQIDNVAVTLVPEPASLALLGLSGLLIGRRRVR